MTPPNTPLSPVPQEFRDLLAWAESAYLKLPDNKRFNRPVLERARAFVRQANEAWAVNAHYSFTAQLASSETATKQPEESAWWKDQTIEEKLRLMTKARDSAWENAQELREDAWRYRWLREMEPIGVLLALEIAEAGRNPGLELDQAIDARRADEQPR